MFTAVILLCTLDLNYCKAVTNEAVYPDLDSCNRALGQGLAVTEGLEGTMASDYKCIEWAPSA